MFTVQRQTGLSLPFGGDVLLLLCEGAEAVLSEEGFPVGPHEALDALAPPAGVPEAAAFQHQRPDTHARTHARTRTSVQAWPS